MEEEKIITPNGMFVTHKKQQDALDYIERHIPTEKSLLYMGWFMAWNHLAHKINENCMWKEEKKDDTKKKKIWNVCVSRDLTSENETKSFWERDDAIKEFLKRRKEAIETLEITPEEFDKYDIEDGISNFYIPADLMGDEGQFVLDLWESEVN